jgi:equilibrative nucleoside transporter 1/2/3
MAGQAAVGVVVSLTQLISTAVSVSNTTRAEEDKDPEAQAAFIFFGLSTIFVLCSAVSHIWLTRTPEYKALVAPLERQRKARSRQASAEEREGLIYGFLDRSSKEGRGRMLQIAKINAVFYFSVGYVLFVTLVRLTFTHSLMG